MSQHNLASAQNNAEDMVAPLTANACITRHKGVILSHRASKQCSRH